MAEEPTKGSAGELQELTDDPTSRKRFLRGLGGGGVAAAGLLIAACGKSKKSSGAAPTTAASASNVPRSVKGDIEIVNYALTLEYLEAQFYSDVIDSGLVKDPKVASLAKKFGQTEQYHVEALTAAVKKLGGTPAAKPAASFQSVLDGGLKKVLETAATVENLGAAAYLGQAGRIHNKEILAAALSIHSVEARHAAALNELVGRGFKGAGALAGSIPNGAFAVPMSMQHVLAQVKPFLQS
jgi:rubrerythrin